MRPGPTNVAALFLTLSSLAAAAQAQCDPQFLPGPDQQYPGINGIVLVSTSWDPDGPGPQASLLIVGGSFSIAGESLASNIAAWDGEHWLPLGLGTSGPVQSLTTYQGELIVGGTFATAGGIAANHMARWNGSQWQALGMGMTSSAISDLDRGAGVVTALSVFDGELIAGGQFSAAGGVTANNIARWDGSAWQALGAGVSSGGPQPVSAMVVHEGELFVGGYLSSAGGAPANKLARWDGMQWRALGTTGPNGRVWALASFQGDLIIGGAFTNIGEAACWSIARWTGSDFQPMGTAEFFSMNNQYAPVVTFAVHEGTLYAAGDFWTASEPPSESAETIARWDGAEWRRVPADGLHYIAGSLTVHNGRLVVTNWDDNSNVLQLEGQTWRPLARGLGTLAALTVYQGELIAGGQLENAGDEAAYGIARWDGARWDSMDLGYVQGVNALAVFNNRLILGGAGRMTTLTANGVGLLQWDGVAWSQLGPTLFTNDHEVDVRELTVSNGSLIVGGDFPRIGDIVTSNIARWDGASWHTMGGGLPNPVRALASYQGECIAVSPSKVVNRFDGTAWQVMESPMSHDVNALLVYEGDLIAAGDFVSIGGAPVSHIARWSGTQWSQFGPGLSHPVDVLTTFGGSLVAVGTSFSNGQWTGHISKWNGDDAWAIDSFSIQAPIHDAVEYNNQLILAGEFTTVEGVVSAFWARWSPQTVDFNHDGDVGTDADIEAFFACLAGDCCPACASADFNGDGDFGTDADIESFFRVLAGGPC